MSWPRFNWRMTKEFLAYSLCYDQLKAAAVCSLEISHSLQRSVDQLNQLNWTNPRQGWPSNSNLTLLEPQDIFATLLLLHVARRLFLQERNARSFKQIQKTHSPIWRVFMSLNAKNDTEFLHLAPVSLYHLVVWRVKFHLFLYQKRDDESGHYFKLAFEVYWSPGWSRRSVESRTEVLNFWQTHICEVKFVFHYNIRG